MLDLAIIVLNYNTADLTLRCLKSLQKNSPDLNYKIWVVDNGSTDNSVEQIKNFRFNTAKLELVINKKNLGFAAGNNTVLKKIYSQARYCLLLNSDTEVGKAAVDNLVKFAQDGNYGISSCKLINPDGSFQPNGGILPGFASVLAWLSGLDDILTPILKIPSYQVRDLSFFQNRPVGWVSGTAMLIKSAVFQRIGFLDEQIFMYGEDVDFCWRAQKAGYTVGWTDTATVVHLGGASSALPRKAQWLGEFKALLYLYQKHYNIISAYLLKAAMYVFIFLRIPAFLLLGKPKPAKTYAEIITQI